MSQIGKNTTFGPFAVRYFPFSHCQKSLIYSYLIYKNAATLITVSIRKKRPLRLIAVRVFSLYALSKIILYTQFQNLIYSLPQQLGLHTVPIIGEKFTINFSSKFSLLNNFSSFQHTAPTTLGRMVIMVSDSVHICFSHLFASSDRNSGTVIATPRF